MNNRKMLDELNSYTSGSAPSANNNDDDDDEDDDDDNDDGNDSPLPSSVVAQAAISSASTQPSECHITSQPSK